VSESVQQQTAVMLISAETRAEIDRWLTKFPADQKQCALLQSLTLVQRENGGWLSTELMDAVAEDLELPKIAVYEVVTFYDMYDLEPVGRHKIDVCTNISCKLCGCAEIMSHLEQRLGVKAGETTADGRYTLKGVECLAACIGAPMMQVDDKHYHTKLTPKKVDAILDAIEAEDVEHGE